jgi:hypothetical protein
MHATAITGFRTRCLLRWPADKGFSMSQPNTQHVVVIGAGAAGLMAARELAGDDPGSTGLMRRGIFPLPDAEFGYVTQGGAEFVHGEAPITHGLLRKAGLMPVANRGHATDDRRRGILRRDVQAGSSSGRGPNGLAESRGGSDRGRIPAAAFR